MQNQEKEVGGMAVCACVYLCVCVCVCVHCGWAPKQVEGLVHTLLCGIVAFGVVMCGGGGVGLWFLGIWCV